MALPDLLFPPTDPSSLSVFSWNNWNHHVQIIQAIRSQKNVTLFEYVIDPIPINDPSGWLLRHQQTHTDANAVLNLQGADLQTLDFSKRNQVEAWIQQHWLEHVAMAAALKIP